MSSAVETDVACMRRAIDLAMRGRGRVEPNPMVGCVVTTADGRVIGEGYHQQYGGPHAEPNALAACTDTPAGATAYVTLEPCCHTNKKTPPCVPALIAARLARVVVGCVDPNPPVSGKGMAQLRAAGIATELGPLQAECAQLAAPFFARVREHRPYVTLKWAQTADGKIAGAGGHRVQISNTASTAAVHALRGRCDGILVGIETVLRDDPALTVRYAQALREPLPIVVDTFLRTPADCRLVQERKRLLLYYALPQFGDPAIKAHAMEKTRKYPPDRVTAIEVGAEPPSGRVSLAQVMRSLASDYQMTHVLVEPGPTLGASFFAHNLVDRVWVIRSRKLVRADNAPPAPTLPPEFQLTAELPMNGDVLAEYLNPRSRVFAAAEPSADFLLSAL